MLTDLGGVATAVIGVFGDITTFAVTNPFVLVGCGVMFTGAIIGKWRSITG